MSRGIFSDLRIALAKLQDDTIAAQVCDQKDWRADSFVDALRGIRHVKQLVDEAEAQSAAQRDLDVLKQAAAQQNGGAS